MLLMDDPVLRSIEMTTEAIRARSTAHWIIAFSGGKDSSAALKIFLAAYRRAKVNLSRMTLIYCDTGVENPVLDAYVKAFLQKVRQEFVELGLSINIELLKAPIPDRFFVRIIGRGYPPPTNSFRWCTTGLRIKPVSEFIAKQNPDNTVVVLGLRQSESRQRDRALALSSNLYWQKQREGKGDYDLFLPVVEMSVPEVWDTIFGLSLPNALDKSDLETLYRGASGECPVIKAPTAPPCASGRFGCWTCTVVRKDKSANELIKSGHFQLRPFLAFRDWLAEFRNDPANRWHTRRNGSAGLGPFTIKARREILRRVDALEDLTATTIIDVEERGVIAALWTMDNFARLAFRPQGNC
ncbi:phosphoadenosine phosphosulfate reductase family protein [Bradyrhizobium sp. I71]|uniref:phosphoadenosine phosphosulfate reductase domain-containing protein n=1 Tax=Bradyrhizobium sp. I71 TaxID=2590772 RepID=UPI001EF89DEB|nr:phosphoadenosine phosphosulfate reductase family protein [Bradyrhizobium sp. I71]ULK95111.1 phosphoadenosine phosphosulfate reductase family protein [Bradyrhizobium sp. I71]